MIEVAKKVQKFVGYETDSYILKAGKSSDLIREIHKGQGKNEVQK